jgi:DNA-directed RNA polymerase specialized sigma24 family protein
MTTQDLAIWVLMPLLCVLGALLWLSESQDQRIRRWKSEGKSQRQIADDLGITVYRVRKALS